MRMAGRHEDFIQRRKHGIEMAIDLYAEDLGPFGPIDRQHAVRRNLLDVFRVVEVIAEGLDAALLDFLSLGFFLFCFSALARSRSRARGRPSRPKAVSLPAARRYLGDRCGLTVRWRFGFTVA